ERTALIHRAKAEPERLFSLDLLARHPPPQIDVGDPNAMRTQALAERREHVADQLITLAVRVEEGRGDEDSSLAPYGHGVPSIYRRRRSAASGTAGVKRCGIRVTPVLNGTAGARLHFMALTAGCNSGPTLLLRLGSRG